MILSSSSKTLIAVAEESANTSMRWIKCKPGPQKFPSANSSSVLESSWSLQKGTGFYFYSWLTEQLKLGILDTTF